MNKKYLYIALTVLIIFVGLIVVVRLVTPEDTWLCKDGQWQEHGNPTKQMPTKECK